MANRMRTIVWLFGLIFLFCGTLRADERSKRLLAELTEKMATYKSYQIDFVVSMPGQFTDVPGRFVVSGDRYYVSFNGTEVFFDGKVVSTYNPAQKEVIIETPNTQSGDLLSNPSRFFRLSEADFSHRYRGAVSRAGGSVEWVELTPLKTGEGYAMIQLQIDPATKLPVSVAYSADTKQDAVTIQIRKFTPDVAVTAAQFTFDRTKHKDVEVIDFR